MTKAVIFYKNGISHKLSIKGYYLDDMIRIVNSNINGYQDSGVDHVNIWIER